MQQQIILSNILELNENESGPRNIQLPCNSERTGASDDTLYDDDAILLSDIDMDQIESDSSDEGSDTQEPPSKLKKCMKADTSASGGVAEWCQKWEKRYGTVKNVYPEDVDIKKPFKLSPKLAAFLGADRLPRHVVVRKIMSFIRENNLYDGSNKNYAECNSQLFEVISVKRFKIFDMLAHLREHFIDV